MSLTLSKIELSYILYRVNFEQIDINKTFDVFSEILDFTFGSIKDKDKIIKYYIL